MTDKGQQKIDFRGGYRPGSGRKKIGVTRGVSITMPEDLWRKFDDERDINGKKNGEMLRDIITEYLDRDF